MKKNSSVPGVFSPSLCHRRLLREGEPERHYREGPVRSWQTRLRRALRLLVGRMPGRRVPLRPRTLWSRPHPLGRIEKIVFASEPGAEVPAYVCLPKDVRPPYRWMLCLQGHSTGMHNSIAVELDDETRPLRVEGDRDFGLGCMRRGVAALCIEQRAFGEREERVQAQRSANRCLEASMHALMLGRTMIGERVWDVDRALDYLETRDDADLRRVGVMGNSGGGTTALFAAALLPRIAIAMPSCYFCTFRDSIMSIQHCVCNYIPGLLNVAEMSDVMGLFAPKPVVLVAGREDPIFPLKGVRTAYRHLRTIYRAAGAEDRCRLVLGPEGHRFYADLAWPALLSEWDRL